MGRDCVLPQFAFRLTCFALRMSAGHSRVYAAVELFHLRSTLAVLAIASSSKGRALHYPPRPSGSPAVRLLFAASSLGLLERSFPALASPNRAGPFSRHLAGPFFSQKPRACSLSKLFYFRK